MKVLLVNPPLCNFRKSSAHSMPMGLLYLAAVLERDGYEAKVIDADALKLTWEKLRERLKAENPNLVGITSTSLSWPAMTETARICKEVLPNSKIIVGGFGATLEPERALNDCAEIDFVCLGEGEKTIIDLVKALESNLPIREVKGLVIRDGNGLLRTEKQETIMDLDTIPPPAYHLLEPGFESYSGVHGDYQGIEPPSIVMFASRGCPHRCIFCSLGSKVVRSRSPKKVVDEIEFYKNKFKVKSVLIYDDEFIGMSTMQNKWILDICDEIIKRGHDDLGYLVEGRCSQFVDLAVLKRMKEAGIKWVWWGVESGSQKVLDSIKKDITIANIKRTFALTRQAGLKSLMFIMTGFPEETEEDVKKTADLLAEVKPDKCRIHIVTPMPGSELFRILNEQKLIDEYDFLEYNMRGRAVHHTKYFSQEEIKKNYEMLKFRFEEGHKKFIKVFFTSFLSVKGLKKIPRRIKKVFVYGLKWLKWGVKY
ncbi:MAG: radical SAM protein [Patescibacteria group bacterium]